MKTVKITLSIMLLLAFLGLNEAICQWAADGSNIHNTNVGNVGIGSWPAGTLLHVAKNITEPTITIQNLGGIGGATYTMMDNASGANWKFKSTNTGAFKIRDHANLMDVVIIESNSFANAIYIKSSDNIGIGTSTPSNSAIVDMTTTSKGFLPPRMTLAQIQTIPDPANGLMVYCITDDKFYVFVESSNAWKEILYGSGTIAIFSCGESITKTHLEGSVAPVNKTVTYGTVNNIPGEPSKCWITSNLGANQQATAVNDASEAAAGWYWQFNLMQGYMHDGTIRTPNITWNWMINENYNWLASNDPCTLLLGSGWRLPTHTEWINVDVAGAWSDWSHIWSSSLKMHAAGYLQSSTGSLEARGEGGDYWSSQKSDNVSSWGIVFGEGGCFVNEFINKANGLTARCLRE